MLIHFFSGRSFECIHNLSTLQKISDQYKPESLTIVGIHYETLPLPAHIRSLQSMIARYRIPYSIAIDPERLVSQAYHIAELPTMVLLRPDGSLSAVFPKEVDDGILLSRLKQEITHCPQLIPSQRVYNPPSDTHPGQLCFPESVAVRHDGLIAISDSGNHRIVLARRFEHRNELSSIQWIAQIGSGIPGLQDGDIDSCAFQHPQGICFDTHGHLWVADTGNHAIRRILLAAHLRASTVLTVAGTGFPSKQVPVFPSLGKHLSLRSPTDVCHDPIRSCMYVAMAGSHQIFRLLPHPQGYVEMERIAGRGDPSSNDGAALQGTFFQPRRLTLHHDVLYISDDSTPLFRTLSLSAPSLIQTTDEHQQPNICRLFHTNIAGFPDIRLFVDTDAQRLIADNKQTGTRTPVSIIVPYDMKNGASHIAHKIPLGIQSHSSIL